MADDDGEERPALNEAVDDVLGVDERTGASRVVEEEAVVRATLLEVVDVSSSVSVEATIEERAVVRRAVVRATAVDEAVLRAVPRTGASPTSSSEAVESGWPGNARNACKSSQRDVAPVGHIHYLCMHVYSALVAGWLSLLVWPA